MRLIRRVSVLVVLAGLAVPAALRAQQPAPAANQEYPGLETGKMWTFDVPPLEYWARRYNFRPTQDWLDHVRLASLRQPGCTASFVSADGLIMTNHHCARNCIETSTRQGEDLLEHGFYARARTDERACRDYAIDQLLSISDVTDTVNAAVPATAPATRAAELRAEFIRNLERSCAGGAPDLNCQVVTMYRGGQFKLYRFRRFTDIRLVFAPEDKMAFFGGDPDNFTFPRHDVDMSFYRAYVNGEPAHTEFFRFARTGSVEGDLVFVVGNPGSTGRLNTIAQLEYLRDADYPVLLASYARRIAVFKAISAASPERAGALRNTIFGLENSQKAVTGYQSGLQDAQLMARKRDWETNFRSRVNADAGLRRQYSDAWTNIQTIRHQMATLDVRRRYYAFGALGSRLLGMAANLVRLQGETAKPDSMRLAAFRDRNRPRLDTALTYAAPIDTMMEGRLLAAYLTAMASELPANDQVLRAALGGKSPEEAARAMLAATRIMTNEQRRPLMTGAAAAASQDPFISLAKVIDPLERDIQRQWIDLLNQEAQNDERVARALLAVFGNTVAPDATFSLRISDGEIKRYPYNGTFAPPFTTLYGLYDRSFGFGGRAPWALPPRWLEHKDAVNLATPLNVAGTNDIIGGNSGSPVVNRDGDLVGLIFDGNMEGLPARFLFTEARGRSVWVDSRGILEVLRHIYDAGSLADELAGGR